MISMTEKDDKVVNLFAEKEEPHLSGTCFCMACKHEWAAACPIGTTELECPKCSAMKGRHKYEVLRREEPHWVCSCKNEYFRITTSCIYCPNCGNKQQPYD